MDEAQTSAPTSLVPGSSHLEIKSFRASRDDASFHDACTIRYNVFVAEQGFPLETELDKIDETCVHLLAYYVSPSWGSGRSVPVGTLRVQQSSDSTIAKISRVAVMEPHRNQGIARRLFLVAEGVARNMGVSQCVLDSQSDKKVVYEKLGYSVVDSVNEHDDLPNGVEEVGSLDDIESNGINRSRRGEFLIDGVWHVKMSKNI